jgi:hypothetical protein
VTPSAWSSLTALQVKEASFGGSTASSFNSANAFFNGATWKRISTAAATNYEQGSGQHRWYYAASDSAGADITFTQAMTLDASGNLLVGTTTSGGLLTLKNSNPSASLISIQSYANTNEIGDISFDQATDIFVISHKLAAGGITFQTNSTERARIDASGNLLVGNTTNVGSARASIQNASGVTLNLDKATGASLQFTYSSGTTDGQISGNAGGALLFSTGNSLAERARITSGGDVLIGQTNNALGTAGHIFATGGVAYHIKSSGAPLILNRLTDDGTLVEFYQDTTLEGNISVSGSTVSYNGGHLARWSQTADGQRIELVKGTVMSNLDQMAVWIDPETGEPQLNEQLNCMKVSDVEGDPNVAGVFVNWDNDDETFTADMNIAMTGDMIIRIADGVTVQRGDLLMSAGDGTAKPQGDDIVRGKTIAKVTSTHVTCTYEDGSYCVPCVLMAC